MARTSEDPRTVFLTEQQCWYTVRDYMNAHATKHGRIALVRHGWTIKERLTSGFRVVATKPGVLG
ncbi:hypothetical protein LCGC14_0753050 [marine sediment metagenome]|uniref:Uncharacterized protein n=1 Tax=marine sediment metagenome TaxID=412755 RepID=A0A0F9SNL8_9ZZZZ